MEQEDKTSENSTELNNLHDFKEEDSTSQEAKTVDGGEASEKNDRKDPMDNSDEPVWDEGNIKKEIEKNQSVINIFHNIKIDNNGGIITGDGAQFQDIFLGSEAKGKDSEKGIADEPQELECWIEQHYGQIDVAFLISCAVFHDMTYSWISEASEKLYKHLGEKEKDSVGKTARAQNIRVFGAKICQGIMDTYAGQIEVDCICFSKEEQVNNILKVVWNEFSQLRKTIVIWLKNYVIRENVLISERARDMLGYLSGLDYYFFSHEMIELFLKNKLLDDDLVLVQILIILYQQSKYKDNIENMLRSWGKLNNAHYLLTTMLVCVIIENQKECLQGAIHIYIDELYQSIKEKRKNEFTARKLSFFAVGMRRVIFYRLLIEELYKKACQKVTMNVKDDICTLFLELFYADVMLCRFEEGVEEEALFVKMVTIKSAFREKLCFLWQMIWERNQYRMLSYDILGQYFSFILRQERRKKISNFVNAAMNGKYGERICIDFTNKILIKCKKYEVTDEEKK